MRDYHSNYVLGGQSKGASSTPSMYLDKTFFSRSLKFCRVYYYAIPGNYLKTYRCQGTQF